MTISPYTNTDNSIINIDIIKSRLKLSPNFADFFKSIIKSINIINSDNLIFIKNKYFANKLLSITYEDKIQRYNEKITNYLKIPIKQYDQIIDTLIQNTRISYTQMNKLISIFIRNSNLGEMNEKQFWISMKKFICPLNYLSYGKIHSNLFKKMITEKNSNTINWINYILGICILYKKNITSMDIYMFVFNVLSNNNIINVDNLYSQLLELSNNIYNLLYNVKYNNNKIDITIFKLAQLFDIMLQNIKDYNTNTKIINYEQFTEICKHKYINLFISLFYIELID